jgi:hypothetical protein
VRRDAEQQRFHELDRRERQSEADGDAGQRDREAVAYDVGHHPPRLCAERDADSDLPALPRDRVRHQTEQADAGKQQGEHAEEAREHGRHAFLQECAIGDVAKRHHLSDVLAPQRFDGALQCRIGDISSAHDEAFEVDGRILQRWSVDSEDIRVLDVVEPCVRGDANHLEILALRLKSDAQMLADRFALAKQPAREAPADHGDAAAAKAVGPREIAALDDRDANRIEEAGRHGAAGRFDAVGQNR